MTSVGRNECSLTVGRRVGCGAMGDHPDTPTEVQSSGGVRTISLLIIAPICSVGLVVVLYLILGPWLPSRVAVHVGPDGVAYGSLLLMLAGACTVAAAAFVIGGVTARGFIKDAHWYQTEKSIAVSIEAFGYGVVGFAVVTLLAVVGGVPEGVMGDSVGLGLLGFLGLLIASICVYVPALPRAEMETMSPNHGRF